jgi:AraC-like DNA-binding protein
LLGLAGGLEDGTITPTDAPDSIECVIDLVRALYCRPGPRRGGDQAPDAGRDPAGHPASIEARLGDPELDPDQIARASFISTRYLHKLFESEGTSVCRWIRRRASSAAAAICSTRARRRDDPDDRQPVGPAGAAALQPALPLGVRVLAERPQARAPQRRPLTAAGAGR